MVLVRDGSGGLGSALRPTSTAAGIQSASVRARITIQNGNAFMAELKRTSALAPYWRAGRLATAAANWQEASRLRLGLRLPGPNVVTARGELRTRPPNLLVAMADVAS
jgi:hypothetical protein